jgi:hypothetical protein
MQVAEGLRVQKEHQYDENVLKVININNFSDM